MDDRPLHGVEWRLIEHAGSGGGITPVAEGVMATAIFDDGVVSGTTGCNRYRATFVADGSRLTVGPMAMTMMACEPERTAVERAFVGALEATVAFAIARETLELADAAGRVVLRLRAAPSLVLPGTRWLATMINNGRGGVASLVEGTVVTAEFGVDGHVAGSGGCNQFTGTYTLDGDTLAIGPLAATARACLAPEGVGEQEAAFFAALARVATWSFREDRLELRAADGALQVELRPAP